MQLRILFQNLIANAVKFRSPERDPVVRISAKENGPDPVVTVADNGIGIPEDKRESVFGLFTRLNSRSRFDGTCLGLAMCRRVMVNHGGSIVSRAGLDGGTAFDLVFRRVGNDQTD